MDLIFAGLLLLSGPARVSATGEAYRLVADNMSFESLQEYKRLIFADDKTPRLVGGKSERDRYYSFPSEAAFLDLVSGDYLLWKKPGFELKRDAAGNPSSLASLPSLESSAEEWERVDRLEQWFQDLESRHDAPTVGFVETNMEEILALQDPDRPRAGRLDIFQVPRIVSQMPWQSANVEDFLEELRHGGHFFLISRAQLDPPMLQEEILYVRADAPYLKPYSFVAPAYEVRW